MCASVGPFRLSDAMESDLSFAAYLLSTWLASSLRMSLSLLVPKLGPTLGRLSERVFGKLPTKLAFPPGFCFLRSSHPRHPLFSLFHTCSWSPPTHQHSSLSDLLWFLKWALTWSSLPWTHSSGHLPLEREPQPVRFRGRASEVLTFLPDHGPRTDAEPEGKAWHCIHRSPGSAPPN